MRLNTEIIDFIRNNDEFDDEVKLFLIQTLTLELKRYKADYKHYFKEYDRIITKSIKEQR
ncbi:hypothetical protein [uncultured Methanobrevibacter sp.]|uniref:hypothetical protein n=1 Tax=uncultured Methanobrevibacter sp. TaxID=253161 RepID=UPI0025E7D149|nr:hypothetical protein [uncultured Methanobrevibacter sp.]